MQNGYFIQIKKHMPGEHSIIMHCHCNNHSLAKQFKNSQSFSASGQEHFPYLTASEAKCGVSYQLMFSILKVKEIKLNTCKNTAKPDIK